MITGALATICAAALVLPAAMTSFGLGVKDGGPLGLKPTADGLAVQTTYAGEIAALNGLCAAIPANASVVFLVYGLDGEWLTEDVRGTCNVPVARLHTCLLYTSRCV